MSDTWHINAQSEQSETYVTGAQWNEDEVQRLLNGSEAAEFIAALIPEPNNPSVRNAVAVHRVGHGRVGWIPREDTAAWESLLVRVENEFGGRITCGAYARVTGTGNVAITLDIAIDDVEREMARHTPTQQAPATRRIENAAEAKILGQIEAVAKKATLMNAKTDAEYNAVIESVDALLAGVHHPADWSVEMKNAYIDGFKECMPLQQASATRTIAEAKILGQTEARAKYALLMNAKTDAGRNEIIESVNALLAGVQHRAGWSVAMMNAYIAGFNETLDSVQHQPAT